MRLQEFRILVANSLAAPLSGYLEKVKKQRPPEQSKEFNDPVWGTITLSPLEVLFLDSPLVQRLRYIKQLGVVHWVYPGANHTRFEHTLGVVHQAQQILTAFNAPPDPQHTQPVVSNDYVQLIRLAALHHDIGHGPFSHVSENALERRQTVQDITLEFAEEQELERAKLSEVVAHISITSQPFVDLTKELFALVPKPPHFPQSSGGPAHEFCAKMANAIIGKPIHPTIPLLHEILNGPFDADKLDYLSRDALFTGVPNTVDISRLTQKITVQQTARTNLPDRIKRRVTVDGDNFYVLGLKWSGASVLDELYLGRTLLFSKVYRHHKVRAAEAMVENLYDVLSDLLSEEDLLASYIKLTDDTLLNLRLETSSAILRDFGLKEQKGKKKDRLVALDLIRLLREREIFVKSFAIQSKFLADPLRGDAGQSQALKAFMSALTNTNQIAVFKAKVVAGVRTLLNNLQPALDAKYSGRALSDHLSVSKPNTPQGGSEISRAIVFPAGGKPITYNEASLNTDAWARAYNLSQAASGFIFCPRELAPYVFVAAEKVVREEYDIILPPCVLDESKQNRERIRQLKVEAYSFGFYQGSHSDLRPEPPVLARADIAERIEALAKKFGVIQEPIAESEQEPRSEALAVRIKNWLAQFGEASLVECAVDALEGMRLISRSDVVDALKGFLDKYPEYKGAMICSIGGGKDSAAHISYYASDLPDSYVSSIMSIGDLLKQKPRGPIIFFDDFCGSGNQVLDILGNWFSEEELKRDLDEQRLPLETDDQKFLKSAKLAFVFCAAWDQGMTQLKGAIESLKLEAIAYRHIGESEIPFAFDGSSPVREAVRAEFKKACEEIGLALMTKPAVAAKQEEKQGVEAAKQTQESARKKARDRALGYGNRGMLLVFPYNVPSQTLTALWAHGTFNGFPWQPLFRRRKKR